MKVLIKREVGEVREARRIQNGEWGRQEKGGRLGGGREKSAKGKRTGTHRWDMEANPPVRTRPRRGMRLLTLQGPTGGLRHLGGAGDGQDGEQTGKEL